MSDARRSRQRLTVRRCKGEEKYHVALLNLFGRHSCYDGIVPDVRLVAFLQPFASWYSVSDRVRWSGDSGRESRLRWRRVDNSFHMWHSTEFFSVPSAARRGMYPALPPDCPSLEAAEYLLRTDSKRNGLHRGVLNAGLPS